MATATQPTVPPGPRNSVPAGRLFAFGRDPLNFLSNLVRHVADEIGMAADARLEFS